MLSILQMSLPEIVKTLERCFRDAVRSCHAAGAADVFDDDWLMKLGAQAVRDDTGDCVGRTAGGERRHHRHRPDWPVLRLRWMRNQNRGYQAHEASRRSGEGEPSARCFWLAKPQPLRGSVAYW